MDRKEKSDPFWFEDMSILFSKDRLVEFFPTEDMSLSEKLNSITRFGIYGGIILYMYNKKYIMLYIPIALLGLTKIIYDVIEKDENKSQEQEEEEENENINENLTNMEVKDLEDEKNRVKEIDGEKCVGPTKNNPFMNVSYLDNRDFNDRPAACKYNDDLKEEINDKFTYNLYQDVSDVFGRNVSSRQFYSMPNTQIPNNQGEFAKWLYGTTGNCKSGETSKCLVYEDLRQNREPVYLDVNNFQYDANKE